MLSREMLGPMDEGVAGCAVHSGRASVATCPRCGRFCCAACGQASPCLECQVRQREACPRLAPLFDHLIGASAVLYALCTVAIVPAIAEVDWTRLKPGDFFSTPVLVAMGIETVYSVVWMVLVPVWLGWYLVLHDWARARDIAVPGKATSLAGALVCGVNFVHPLLTLLKVRRGTRVATPLATWWFFAWGSVLLASVRMTAALRGAYDPLFIAASAMEVVAVLLCWKIARDFRHADQAWDPKAQLAART